MVDGTQLDAHVTANRAGHTRHELAAAAVEDRNGVADAESKHARQMLRLVTRKDDYLVARIHRGGKETVHAADYKD